MDTASGYVAAMVPNTPVMDSISSLSYKELIAAELIVSFALVLVNRTDTQLQEMVAESEVATGVSQGLLFQRLSEAFMLQRSVWKPREEQLSQPDSSERSKYNHRKGFADPFSRKD